LGALIAGGRSLRYGSPKALALVNGERIIDRVIAALRTVLSDIILIGSDQAVIAAANLEARPDVLPGLGALGGIHAALLRAREIDRAGVLAVACDMPFLSVPLLRYLLQRAQQTDAPDAVLPEGGGRRGVEPLCAWYRTTCIAAIEDAVRRGDLRMIGFQDAISMARVPLDVVSTFGDPAVLFMNVNTPQDRELAERIAAGTAHA
jgi:molybdopterin-guanine dinucleotide biosynthesis protein A